MQITPTLYRIPKKVVISMTETEKKYDAIRRAYMLTTLYNASLTMDNYYSALVNHDLYGQK